MPPLRLGELSYESAHVHERASPLLFGLFSQALADDIRRKAWEMLANELPHGTAWRAVEEQRKAAEAAGSFKEVDLRRMKLGARKAAEKED